MQPLQGPFEQRTLQGGLAKVLVMALQRFSSKGPFQGMGKSGLKKKEVKTIRVRVQVHEMSKNNISVVVA